MSGSNNNSNEGGISAKEISFPKGGGAIKGMGSSFEANTYSGAGTYSISIPAMPARGFEPQLSINYSSGAGNGIFGLGFSLSLSKISVSSDNGIPKYEGRDPYQIDGSLLVIKNSTIDIPNPRIDVYENQEYQVTLYLTRTEKSFSQVEHWQLKIEGDSFWKVITADNTTSYYGIRSKIANPGNPVQIYEWLIDQSLDSKGNQIFYSYLAENNVNVPDSVYELNRSNSANRYIHKVKYGNYVDASGDTNFAFEIVFNYGQPGTQQPDMGWTCRKDPFSSYTSGFEVRTYRLCQNIQMVHVFPEELGEPVVVKDIVFTYENLQQYSPIQFQAMSMLTKAVLSGYRKELNESQPLPALELGYSAFIPPLSPEFKMLSVGEGTIPGYLDAREFLPVDLQGEGLPGFLLSNPMVSLYLEPLGDGKYKLPVANRTFPVNQNLQEGESILTDLDGDGQLELMVNSTNTPGFYSHIGGEWKDFVPFEKYPTAFSEPKTEMVDLAGNGKTDLFLASMDNIRFYPSEGKKGYSAARDVPRETDFPLIKQEYQKELTTFSNIFGDGLSHRVKISSGLVECWPCLGYGKFGKKVTLANAPLFAENFDSDMLFLTDVDGSGTTDLAYAYPDRVEIFINQSGNSFSNAIVVHLPEVFGSNDRISFADILGNGTACLVFTKIAPVPKHYYYNFSGESSLPDGSVKQSLKPYLLNKTDNNMGSVSYINYCSSTKFFLEDKQAGKPWVTRLPFPIQVVEEVSQYEYFSQSRYVSRYKYHQGYYSPDEKQFLGFGFTESWDSESFEVFQSGYSIPDYPVEALNQELFVPPVYTKSWYLNGAPAEEYDKLLTEYKLEYFDKDIHALCFPESRFSPDIANSNGKTFLEAYNALSSKLVRREVYALDGTSDSDSPYTVEEWNYDVALIQPAREEEYAVFSINQREQISYHYERCNADPRIEQQFILQTDSLCGKPIQSCTIYLPRRNGQTPDYPEQYTLKGVISTFKYHNSPPSDTSMRLRGIQYEEQGFELLGIDNPSSGYFSFDDILLKVETALQNIISYLDTASAGIQAQQYSKATSFFSDSGRVLPLGKVSPQALLHHISTAEFSKNNITSMFGQRLTDDTIRQLGGYVYDPISGYWENQGLSQLYLGATGFYLPSGTSSDLGMMSTVDYDNYYLAPVKITSFVSVIPPVTNIVTLTMDYQAMAPKQLEDINGNVNQALFDGLGQVIVTSIFGTENGVATGAMRLYEYQGKESEYQHRTTAPDGKPISFESVIKDDTNKAYYLQGASSYFCYDLNAFPDQKRPAGSVQLQRINYAHNPEGPSDFSCQTIIAYSDGLARSLATKTEVEPEGSTERWLVSGRSVYNNKGKVCESYLPYFSDTPFYQTQKEITGIYQPPPPTITHYDALLRVIKIDTPKGFFSKTEFTAWQQNDWDEDDTVTDSVYYTNFMRNYPAEPTQEQVEEKKALEMAAVFFGTYTTTVMDNMGNAIRNITLLKGQTGLRQLTSYYELDIQGRRLTEIDPRLYADNTSKGTSYYNFRYQYSMGSTPPLVIDSADAGITKNFRNIFEKPVWSLSARDYCQVIYYDGLQRQTQLLSKKIPGGDPITGFNSFNLVELFVYGEAPDLPSGYNLRGNLYILKDLSGIVTNSSYSMLGSVLQTSRQMTTVYKTAINWHDEVPLETGSSGKICSYNALNLQIIETTTDNDIDWNKTTYIYNLNGLLKSILVTNAGLDTAIIKNISYDANRQRTEVIYGNSVVSKYNYEASTLRLTRILSQSGSLPSIKTLQNIAYTYDPVGNITCTRDFSIDTVFNNNQKIEPVSSYRYDSLYRLTQANGRQHPGISSNSFKNNIAQGSFMQSIYSQSPINDSQAIENYTENYSYDDSGNLIKKQHVAVSSSWNVDTAVLQNCNRLKDLEYDQSGNQRQLAINNMVSLSYNCCENLVSAAIIERPDQANDSDYYVYGNSEQRSRKVSEQYISASSVNYSDTVYYGNYEIQSKGIQASDGSRTVTTRRKSIRILDGKTCVAIIYHWDIGGSGVTAGTTASDQLRYQMTDKLGSIAIELTEQGALMSYEEYFSYGGTSFIAGPNQVDVALKTYRYSGKECDNTTGLYYYGMRYYVCWLGRWLNPDPAGTVDGLNLFAFVKSNPIGLKDNEGLVSSTNKYEWLVNSSTDYISPDVNLNLILENFGHPVTSVVKNYDDLASRIGYDVNHNAKGNLSSSTVTDLHQAFEASIPLHYGFNTFLGEEWRDNMTTYSGAKRKIPLYSVMRSKTTTQFKSETFDPVLVGFGDLNEVLYEVSQRPAEVHHILYKAVRPQYANQTSNLMLVERSTKESVYGPGQHELMHMLGSGNHSNKFSVLLPQFESEYISWYKAKQSVTTMRVSSIE